MSYSSPCLWNLLNGGMAITGCSLICSLWLLFHVGCEAEDSYIARLHQFCQLLTQACLNLYKMCWCCKQEWFCLSLQTLWQSCNTGILLGINWVMGMMGCHMLLLGVAGSFHVTWSAAVLSVTNQVSEQKDCSLSHPPKEGVKTENVQAGACLAHFSLRLCLTCWLWACSCVFSSSWCVFSGVHSGKAPKYQI